MRAVVVRGLNEVAVETVEDARIEAPTDVLLRVTSAAICGTDLHIYEGRMGDVAGMVIGHEPLGVVEWEGRWSDYEFRDGMLISLAGELAWMPPEGPKPYWPGRITNEAYEWAQ